MSQTRMSGLWSSGVDCVEEKGSQYSNGQTKDFVDQTGVGQIQR